MTLSFTNGKWFPFFFAFTCALFISCDNSDFEHENKFDRSYQAWLDFKEASGDSYRYQVRSSSWTGTSSETTITVTDGLVTQRHYKITSTHGMLNVPKEALEWTENKGEINSHQNAGAVGALTLEEVYEKARSEWLVKDQNAKTYFEADNKGMISLCGYVEDGCQDDCFVGINISFIEGL